MTAAHRRLRLWLDEPAARKAPRRDIPQVRNRQFNVEWSVMGTSSLSRAMDRTSYQHHAGTKASGIQPCGVRATQDAGPGVTRFQCKWPTRHRPRRAGADTRVLTHVVRFSAICPVHVAVQLLDPPERAAALPKPVLRTRTCGRNPASSARTSWLAATPAPAARSCIR